jgi:holo-[acyl-carrier protein] synthase
MTLSIGTDIVEIARIKSVYERQGQKITKRILTPTEQARFEQLPSDDIKVTFLAKRWCAKEAVAKALGTGIAKGVGFQQIQINNNELGAPSVELFEEALNRLAALGGQNVLISISDERHYAVAFCTLS